MKRLAMVVGVAVLLVIGVLISRTLMHAPNSTEIVEKLTIEIDVAEAAQHLSEAIRYVTISHQSEADIDRAAFQDFIDWARITYPEVHQQLQLQRLNDTLLYRWQGRDDTLQPILVTGHYDVVPVIPGTEEKWQHPPFEGVIDNGVIWGRGALDDKSGVIGLFEAAELLLRQDFQPERTIYLSFGHDEELGGTNGASEVAGLLKSEGVQLAWTLDEGSFLLSKMLPGVDPLVATINVAEKGSVTLLIVAKADGGHSSMPPKNTAVGILAAAIVRLEDNPVPGGLSGLSAQMFDEISRYMPFMPRLLFANQWLFSRLLDNQLSSLSMTNAMLRTTTAPTMLSGSIKTNVLPIEAIAAVNFRIHPRDSVQDVIDHVRKAVESDVVEVRVPEYGGRAASEVSDWNSEGYAVIARSTREVYGEVVITPGLMIAGSDTRHYGKVADNSFRYNPFVVTSEDLTGFHGTNEKITVDNFAQGIRTYIQILKNGSGR